MVDALGAEWPCLDNYSQGYNDYHHVCIYTATVGGEIEAHAEIDQLERIYLIELTVHPTKARLDPTPS
jgi:hypothetical protein